jgi:hypothetical protein
MVAVNEQLIRSGERFAPRPHIATRPDRAGDHPVPSKRFHPGFHRPRKQPIVRIEEDQEVSAAFRNSGVSGSRCALIRLTTILDLGVPFRDLAGVVRGTVVDHEYLDPAVALIQDALQSLAQKVGLVVAWDDDRDQRFADLVLFLRSDLVPCLRFVYQLGRVRSFIHRRSSAGEAN